MGGVQYDYGFRIYNPGIARFLSVDPLASDFSYYSPYLYAGNNPIQFIDVDGGFKFDPATLTLLKQDYSRAYHYFTQTDKLLEFVQTDGVAKIMITNTGYIKALQMKNAVALGKSNIITLEAGPYLESAESMKLSRSQIYDAFTYDKGPFIEMKENPGGRDGNWSGGFNKANDGTDYGASIELNIAMFQILEDAETHEEIQAALATINSLILHEYMEFFGDDNEDIGNGEFGAGPTQHQIFGWMLPEVIGFDGIDWDMFRSKEAIKMMKEAGKPESLMPTLDKPTPDDE